MPSLFPVLVLASFLVGRASASKVSKIVKLNNGVDFPSVSFGLQEYDMDTNDDTAEKLTTIALKAGIRNFFSSIITGNQKGFGRAIAKSSVPRKDIFICGSVATGTCSGETRCKTNTLAGCEQNLQDIGVKKLDMVLLDYPASDCPGIQGQWQAFEEFLKAGKTRSLAISNFNPSQLDCLLDIAETKPAVNQVRFNMNSHKGDPILYNAQHGNILVQAYTPLDQGSAMRNSVVQRVAKAHNKTPAQICLRWILQSGATFTVSSKSLAHFKEDLDLFGFTLSDDEMKMLTPIGQPNIVVVHG